MKIYLAHSRNFNYEEELYKPLRASKHIPQENFILPHENLKHAHNSRDFYRDLDLMIAEVSYPATGLGIEMGWAYDDKIPLVAIHKTDAKVSGSIHVVTDQIYEYTNSQDLVDLVTTLIQQVQK